MKDVFDVLESKKKKGLFSRLPDIVKDIIRLVIFSLALIMSLQIKTLDVGGTVILGILIIWEVIILIIDIKKKKKQKEEEIEESTDDEILKQIEEMNLSIDNLDSNFEPSEPLYEEIKYDED